MVKIGDEIYNNLEWKRMRVSQQALEKLLKSKKVIWLEMIGTPSFPEGLIIYLEGAKTLELLEIYPKDDDDTDFGFLAVERAKVKKDLVEII